jgi:membrane fusion protein (multidrug efflux system)
MSQSQLTTPESKDMATSNNAATNGKVNNGVAPNTTTNPVTNLEESSDILTTPETDQRGAEVAETEAEQPSNPKQKNPLFLFFGAIALGALALGGWKYWEFASTHVSTENAQIQGHLSPIAAKVSANIQQVLVKEGEYVEAGQPLIMMTDEDLPWKLKQAEAGVAIAQAQLKTAQDNLQLTSQTFNAQLQQAGSRINANQAVVLAAQAKIAQSQAAVNTNQARVAQAQTEVNRTEADWQRYNLLYSQGAVSAQQADAAKTAYANAQANLAAVEQTVSQAAAEVNSAQAQLAQTQANVDVAQGQLNETQGSEQGITVQQDQQQLAQAQVQQAQANLSLVQQQSSYMVIRAPISGYIGELTAQVGQKTQVGQPLLSLVPLNAEQVYVQANFKETELHKLRVGETATVTIDAYPEEKFSATVAGISPATGASFALIPPDNATGNFNKVTQWVPVRLTFNSSKDPLHHLRPGLSVGVTVDVNSSGTNSPASEVNSSETNAANTNAAEPRSSK